jgi:hypothetical protein
MEDNILGAVFAVAGKGSVGGLVGAMRLSTTLWKKRKGYEHKKKL